MFYSLSGNLIHIEPGIAVIDCAGVGYKCFTTINTQKNLPSIGTKTTLYTHLNVREDDMDLFGFFSKGELNCFKMLTSVSGVGAKVGLAILSEFSPEQVAISIASGDSKNLTKAAGVGNKLAQRIILELKDKLKGMDVNSGVMNNENNFSSVGNASEALKALNVLGYSTSEVSPVIAKLDSNLPVEELIRLSLKAMAGRN